MPVSLKELASRAGVSVQVVSRVLTGGPASVRVSEKRAEQVRRIARELGYRPNAAARAMQSGRSRQVGVVTLDDPVFRYAHMALFDYLRGVNEGLDSAGYLMTVVRVTDVEHADREPHARIFKERAVDGLIAINLLPDRALDEIKSLQIPVVWLDTNIDLPTCCVRRDERAAARLAVQKLYELGHRRIHLFYNESKETGFSHYSAGRVDSALEAARELGITAALSELTIDDRRDLALLEALPIRSGLIAVGEYAARRLNVCAAALRLRFGVDHSLICLDDASDLAWWWPGLARVSFDRVSLGRSAAKMLLSMLDSPSIPEGKPSSMLDIGRVAGGSTLIQLS